MFFFSPFMIHVFRENKLIWHLNTGFAIKLERKKHHDTSYVYIVSLHYFAGKGTSSSGTAKIVWDMEKNQPIRTRQY